MSSQRCCQGPFFGPALWHVDKPLFVASGNHGCALPPDQPMNAGVFIPQADLVHLHGSAQRAYLAVISPGPAAATRILSSEALRMRASRESRRGGAKHFVSDTIWITRPG